MAATFSYLSLLVCVPCDLAVLVTWSKTSQF